MLVFNLYDGQSVHIGDDIKIVIDRCVDDGASTRIGIEAPKEVEVLREELIKKD